MSAERTFAQMFDESLQIILESLGDDLDREIGEVLHVSDKCEMPCVLSCKIPIGDALHLSADTTVDLLYFHVRAEGFEPPTFRV